LFDIKGGVDFIRDGLRKGDMAYLKGNGKAPSLEKLKKVTTVFGVF